MLALLCIHQLTHTCLYIKTVVQAVVSLPVYTVVLALEDTAEAQDLSAQEIW